MTDYIAIKNERLIKIYTDILSNIFPNNMHNFPLKNMVLCRVIHRDEDFCFNSEHREILYSIRDCFSSANIWHPVFRENLYGKCLTIPIDKMCMKPPFENILYYYQKHFLHRLEVIDIHFTNRYNKQSFNDTFLRLKTEKKALYITRFAYNTIYIPLPLDILNYIFGYLKYIYVHKSSELRKKYENLRHQ